MSDLAAAALWHEERPKTLGKMPRTTVLRAPHIEVGETSTRTESLCGQVDCKKCGSPREQLLTHRTMQGGETWAVLPCPCGGAR